MIISCTNFGEHHAATSAVAELQSAHAAVSAGLKVPCPWARYAASLNRGADVGVRLTLNAEHDIYRWGPITHSPSLLDGNGGFPVTLEDLWDHAELDEVRRECRAQLERAISWGFDVSHLSSHFDALLLRPEFFDVALDLALEFALPIELPDEAVLMRAGFRLRDLAAEEGVVFAGRVVELDQELRLPHPSGSPAPGKDGDRDQDSDRGDRDQDGGHRDDEAAAAFKAFLSDLAPGVTVLRISPAINTAEHRALTDSGAGIAMYRTVLATLSAFSPTTNRLNSDPRVQLITYRDLRSIQRSGAERF